MQRYLRRNKQTYVSDFTIQFAFPNAPNLWRKIDVKICTSTIFHFSNIDSLSFDVSKFFIYFRKSETDENSWHHTGNGTMWKNGIFTPPSKIFRENNLLMYLLYAEYYVCICVSISKWDDFTKFLQKKNESKILWLPHCKWSTQYTYINVSFGSHCHIHIFQ